MALRSSIALRPATRALPRPTARPVRAASAARVDASASPYSKKEEGKRASLEYRIFMEAKGAPASWWHDVPLRNADGTLNFICEIPKESSAKMEVATDEKLNPIKQDVKKGALRFYPYNINWNYGLLPQTWEDPAVVHPELEVAGDNDPVDVVEIGAAERAMGSVTPVKPLGALAMIDDGELDWKIICIAADDPKAGEVNDVEDVERVFPGELDAIRVWFRDYKTPDGKPQNKFGYNNRTQPKAFAEEVIEETHGYWKALTSGARANDEELAF